MIKKIILMTGVALIGLLPTAFARDNDAAGQEGRTETRAEGVFQRRFDVQPTFGYLSYRDVTNADRDDLLFGATGDWNVSTFYNPADLPLAYGVRTGVLFSPLNSVDGESLFMVPLNVFAGYTIEEKVLLGGHAGGNLFLQGDTPTVGLGAGTGDVEIRPNVGADAAWSITEQVALVGRIDFTLAQGGNPFMGTLGVAIPLG